LAIGVIAAWSSSASAQILDRVLGRDSRTRVEERPVERQYVSPTYRDWDDDDERHLRYYRGGTEARGGTQYRGEAEFRGGERTSTRTVSHARRGSTLIGSTVRLDSGQTLGRIDDIVISESGCVDFMVVSVSGLRGLSGQLAVLPFAIGEADFSRRVVYVDWVEEDLRRAPIFFSSSRWPDFTDTEWTGEVFAYFEVDSHDMHRGRAYREPRESDGGRFDDRPARSRDSRDRDYDRDSDERSYRSRDSSDRSTRERDSYDREQDRSRSDTRSRSREMRDEDEDQRSDQSSRANESRDRSSDRDRSTRTRDDDRDSSDRSKTDKSEDDEKSESKSSDRQPNSKKNDLPD
jgi:hypothetical protein